MNTTVALTGNDTVKINDRILNDFADGDIAMLTVPNDIAAVKTGKNGNSVFAYNETGRQAELQVRLIRGSADDKFLNALLNSMKNGFASFVLMQAELVKNIGNGAGAITQDISVLNGGVFKKQPETKSNVEGDTEQSITVYTIAFANLTRAIG